MLRNTLTFIYCFGALLTLNAQNFSPFTRMGPGGGGYMYSPSISPHQPADIWLNCDMGGIYHSLNQGEQWDLVPYAQLVATVKGKVQFTSDPQIMYAVGRSLTNTDDPLFRGELFKSEDGGQSWSQINDPTSTGIHRLFVDPASTQRLLLSEYDRLFLSNDGGNSWSLAYAPPSGRMWLAGVHWQADQILVATGEGLLFSNNGGANFEALNIGGLPDGQGIVQFAAAKNDTTLRLFVLSGASADLYAWLDPIEVFPLTGQLFTLDFGSATAWKPVPLAGFEGLQPQWVATSEHHIADVWVVAANDQGNTFVLRSTDAGQHWGSTFGTLGNSNLATGWAGDGGIVSMYWNSYFLGIDVDDNDPNRVILTDGQVHFTENGGQTWEALYVVPETRHTYGQPSDGLSYFTSSGLDVTSAYSLLFLDTAEVLVGGIDAGCLYSKNGGASWSFDRNWRMWGTLASRNWYGLVRHSNAPNTLYAAVSEYNDLYMSSRIGDDIENSNGILVRSQDQGLTWDTLLALSSPVTGLVQHPTLPNHWYAGVYHHQAGGILHSSDNGATWAGLAAPPRTEGHPNQIRVLANGDLVVSYSARAVNDAPTPSSGVFLSTDGGQTWEDRTHPNMQYYTKDLVIDPHDSTQRTWYASVWGRYTTFLPADMSNVGNGGIYRTKDAGLTWERIFVHERAESMAVDPLNPHVLYVSVEWEGLFKSIDLQSNTPSFERVLDYPFARPKRIFFNPYQPREMWVTTMGGGVWKRVQTPVSGTQAPAVAHSKVWPNPTSTVLQVSITTPLAQRLRVYDASGKVCYALDAVAADHQIRVADWPSGWYFVQILGANGELLGCNMVGIAH